MLLSATALDLVVVVVAFGASALEHVPHSPEAIKFKAIGSATEMSVNHRLVDGKERVALCACVVPDQSESCSLTGILLMNPFDISRQAPFP